MAIRKRFNVSRLGMLACLVVCSGSACEQAFGQEALPTMRRSPRERTAWVGDSSEPASATPVPKREVVVPRNNYRQAMPANPNLMITTRHPGAVAVSDEPPPVRDRRVATLKALADGFRTRRFTAPLETEPQAAIIEPTVPVTYAAPPAEEPVTLVQQTAPVEVAPPVHPTANVAAVEANTPATLERLPPLIPEIATTSQAKFHPAVEDQPRVEALPARMISNPLRRAVDSISSRRNPLRSAD